MKKFNLKVVKNFKFFGPVALALILTGLILILTIGMNIGIDFAGGAILKFDLGDYAATHQEVKEEVKQLIIDEIKNDGFVVSTERWSGDDNTVLELGLGLSLDGNKINVTDVAEQKNFRERIEGTIENNNQDGLSKRIETLVLNYNGGFDEVIFEYDFVGASAEKLLKNAIWATAVAIVVMLIYIIIRFTLASGLAAVICLFHDVLAMITLTTIFRIQVNTTFIAAVITIIGYSINATIVLFDRIREYEGLESLKGKPDYEIADMAVSSTLNRTILTTLTTLAVIVILAIVCAVTGVSTMAEFALPIIFGLIAGTYSSVLLAPSIWVYLKKLGAKIKKSK